MPIGTALLRSRFERSKSHSRPIFDVLVRQDTMVIIDHCFTHAKELVCFALGVSSCANPQIYYFSQLKCTSIIFPQYVHVFTFYVASSGAVQPVRTSSRKPNSKFRELFVKVVCIDILCVWLDRTGC